MTAQVKLDLAWAWTCPACTHRNLVDLFGSPWAPGLVICDMCLTSYKPANIDFKPACPPDKNAPSSAHP